MISAFLCDAARIQKGNAASRISYKKRELCPRLLSSYRCTAAVR